MPLSLYECAYSKLRSIICTCIYENIEIGKRQSYIEFLLKIISLDMSITIDSYHSAKVKDLLKSIDSLEKKSDRLKELSHSDPLTSIANRSRILSVLNSEVKKISTDESISVIMMDIVNLGEINDSKGHLAGDLIIREFARRLSLVSHKNLFGRYGGDEFLMILYDADLAIANKIVKSNKRLIENNPFIIREEAMNIKVSQGVVQVHPDESLSSIIHRAGIELTKN